MRQVLAAALLLALVAPAGADEAEPPAWAKALRLRGRLAEEFAYRLHDPGDVSKLKTLGWLDGKYAFSESVAVRAAVRGWYDAVFEATDRYPANVERDQKTDLSLREALLIVGLGDLDVRLGRQQIVWGEAISTFVTDVVNPKDFREFVLPDFSELRIPIWALDATYRLAEGVSVEGVWTPDTRTNKLPKQGAEFQFARFPYRFRNAVVRLPDDADEFSLARSEGGFRLSVLRQGWDVGDAARDHGLLRQHAEPDRALRGRRQPRRLPAEPADRLPGQRRRHAVGRRRPLRGPAPHAVRPVRQERSRDLHHHLEVLRWHAGAPDSV